MYRDHLQLLNDWVKHPLRKPLVIRGARQVGKTWLVEKFANQFIHFIKVNFDKEHDMKALFESESNLNKLLERLSLLKDTPVIAGKTLLFLDEIQECERAITYLRYFKEEIPDLHVIAAGSLIDFVLQKTGMPVGRVQFLYLFPLTFSEYLSAMDYQELRQYLLKQEPDALIHKKMISLLRTYLWLGGMPAVVDAWRQYGDIASCREIQQDILVAYEQDFQKYAKRQQVDKVAKVFRAVPQQIGKKFIYTHIDREEGITALKNALTLLEKAGIIHYCHHTSAQQLPLGASRNERKFKVFFFDVGLMQSLLTPITQDWIAKPLTVHRLGSIAEQFVAQEMIAHMSGRVKGELYYWHREAKSSNAEVDFVITRNSDIVPVEVKSSSKGGLKSLHLFLEKHPYSEYGVKISEQGFARQSHLLDIPLYGIESLFKSEQ